MKAAVFTHHHVDHIFATKKFDEDADKSNQKRPIVYSHKLLPDHFDRYKKTLDGTPLSIKDNLRSMFLISNGQKNTATQI